MKIAALALALLAFVVPAFAAGPANPTQATWKAPTLNTDGTALTDLASYNVYVARGSTQPAFPGPSWTKVANVPAAAATPAPNTVINWGIPQQPDGQNYLAVTAVDASGNESLPASAPFLVDRLKPGAPDSLLLQ